MRPGARHVIRVSPCPIRRIEVNGRSEHILSHVVGLVSSGTRGCKISGNESEGCSMSRGREARHTAMVLACVALMAVSAGCRSPFQRPADGTAADSSADGAHPGSPQLQPVPEDGPGTANAVLETGSRIESVWAGRSSSHTAPGCRSQARGSDRAGSPRSESARGLPPSTTRQASPTCPPKSRPRGQEVREGVTRSRYAPSSSPERRRRSRRLAGRGGVKSGSDNAEVPPVSHPGG